MSNYLIDCDPKIMVGKPCIKGTRITVEVVLKMIASGMSTPEIINDFPQLNENKINSAVRYAAENLRRRA